LLLALDRVLWLEWLVLFDDATKRIGGDALAFELSQFDGTWQHPRRDFRR
jgi:hypothetical protein